MVSRCAGWHNSGPNGSKAENKPCRRTFAISGSTCSPRPAELSSAPKTNPMNFLCAFIAAFIVCWIAVPILLVFLAAINFYTTVMECRAKVYVLFGRVLGVVSEPGLHLLWLRLGPQAALVRFFGRMYEIDTRLDQEYLRSNPVNTEEGTPMGVGIWYEMRVKNPVDYLFKNLDPRGSLRANVANATVRNLSNLPLQEMLDSRWQSY